MRVRLVEPLLNPDGSYKQYTRPNGNVHSYTDDEKVIFYVRPIAPTSPKHRALMTILEQSPCRDFIELGNQFKHYIRAGLESTAPVQGEYSEFEFFNSLDALYIMTDFTDPRPMQGLCLVEDGVERPMEDLYYLALHTDWERLDDGNFEHIFGHECSHLWLLPLMADCVHQFKSNKFHTITAITDSINAFLEGFAEHLEIVTCDYFGCESFTRERLSGLWDYALDINAWLSYRDSQLRYFAVKNNRFVYQTALPDLANYTNYIDLHLDHITSSSFTPDQLKNGSQILASEGAIAAIFYHIFAHPLFKNTYMSEEFYHSFGVEKSCVPPVHNLYMKIFAAMARINYADTQQPMIQFIATYGELFPEEQLALYELFLNLTHFTTVSRAAAVLFENFYRIGRRGQIEPFKAMFNQVKDFKAQTLAAAVQGEIALDAALYPQVWVKNRDCKIPPCPWFPERTVEYIFDLNTATVVDLLSLGVTVELAKHIVDKRERCGGFTGLSDFLALFPEIPTHMLEPA